MHLLGLEFQLVMNETQAFFGHGGEIAASLSVEVIVLRTFLSQAQSSEARWNVSSKFDVVLTYILRATISSTPVDRSCIVISYIRAGRENRCSDRLRRTQSSLD